MKKTKTYKPYEVKPFTVTLKEGKKVVTKTTVRRWDVFVMIREEFENDPGVFEDKMTVRKTNSILDGLILEPKTKFTYGEPSMRVEVKWAGKIAKSA